MPNVTAIQLEQLEHGENVRQGELDVTDLVESIRLHGLLQNLKLSVGPRRHVIS